jgi:hypothetical protein
LPAPNEPPTITVTFGTAAQATAVTSLAPSLAMPRASYSRPTMKPVMFCRNSSGTRRWQHSSMKCAPFWAIREQDAVVGHDPDRHPVQPAQSRSQQRRAVEALELVELRAVDQTPRSVRDVVALLQVGRDQRIDVLDRVLGSTGAFISSAISLRELSVRTILRTIASAWTSSVA